MPFVALRQPNKATAIHPANGETRKRGQDGMNTNFRMLIAGCWLLAGSGMVHAALVDRGGGLIYDNVLNVTWLANANLARTQTFGVSGISPNNSAAGDMSWYTAQAWLAAMNSSGYLGYSDWRLPRVMPVNGVSYNDDFSTNGTTDVGYNIVSTNSELAHLANVDFRSVNICFDDPKYGTCPLYYFGSFSNVDTRYTYYTETEISPGSENVRAFSIHSPSTVGPVNYDWGRQGIADKGNTGVVMVLRDGDVAGQVPEPQTLALALIALGALGFTRRHRH